MPGRAGDTLLVCYDSKELRALLAAVRESGSKEIPGSRFPLIAGTLDGQPVAVSRIPFGDDPGRLEAVLSAILDAARPSRLISIGSAMACSTSLAVGDILALTGAGNKGEMLAFGQWLAPAAVAASARGLRIRPGRSLTTTRFVTSASDRDRLLADQPDADAIEMEDYHLARMAANRSLPFASLRAITDRGSVAGHMANLEMAASRVVRALRRALRQERMTRHLSSMDNPPTRELGFRVVVQTPGQDLPLPEAVTLARRAIRGFGLDEALPRDSRIDLIVTQSEKFGRHIASPSGRARVFGEEGAWLLVRDDETPSARLLATPARIAREQTQDIARRLRHARVTIVDRSGTGPLSPSLPAIGPYHIQGLNSLSAEPEEGLLAATTADEFRDHGLVVARAAESPTWIYRSANSSDTSYFQLEHPVPMRPDGGVPPGTYLIATGLGPAIDPAANGGREASTLLLGDEQGGRLAQLLDDLTRAPFDADDVFRYPGLVQRLAQDRVALSRIDRRLILTPEGMNSLHYNPDTLRQIYSQDYDRFLRDYFSSSRRRTGAKASHLLMTSRGCGYHCSFCCSGGLQPFSALSDDTFIGLLREIHRREQLGNGEHADVFLTDSYFNRNAERVIRLAERLETEGLLRDFEFYVRHSGLQAFLARRASATEPPAVNGRLIDAYARLGIDEIVLGVDAYTDDSIRMLKTNFDQVVQKGEDARPIYTFRDIEAVLGAIQAAGLRSRCFLLVYNPFADDSDRLLTFYNLVRLALVLPGFRIDSTSSDRVNELKPFPGAPLTRVAEAVPGLIAGSRFDYRTDLGRLEDLLDFEAFGERREQPAALTRFVASIQASRHRVVDALTERLSDRDAAPAARSFLRTLAAEERALSPILGASAADTPELIAGERSLGAAIDALAERAGGDSPYSSEQRRLFFELLERPEVRRRLGHDPRK